MSRQSVGWSLVLTLLAATTAQADDKALKVAGRALLSKYQDALVSVKLVLKAGNVESQAEIAGTVLSPTGLTVVSDFTSNPGGLFGDDPSRTETTDVKLVLQDGKELPAKF